MTNWWIALLIVALAYLDRTNSECIFDAIRPNNAAVTYANYAHRQEFGFSDNAAGPRQKREASLDDLFSPIRVSTFFLKLEIEDLEQQKLKTVIFQTVSLIRKILSVIPVEGPLLLNRSGCKFTWLEGINKGKCGFAVKNYRGEFCMDVQIPNDHLDDFLLWNSAGLEPKEILNRRGSGVNNTDFILYVQSVSTSECTSGELNIIAYATYCRLDQNRRPVAGYINICPNMIRENGFDGAKISLTVLHELFHALGFSSDLFMSFQDCSLTGGGNRSRTCRPLYRAVRAVRGARRLVTNRVSELASAHFGCNGSGNDFGPILQTAGNVIKSHWDAAFMQGSLMTPTISQPHLTFLDPMTLAVFEDSGWYRVNYDYAQEYYWGKGQGCDFALSSSCNLTNSNFFCQQHSSVGCHFLHTDKGTCGTNPFLRGCSLYNSQLEDSCQLSPKIGRNDNSPFESFGNNSRCFLSNLTQLSGDELSSTTNFHLTGRCYPHFCNATGHLFVRVLDDWIYCPEGQLIQTPRLNGAIKCPSAEVLCRVTRELFDDSTVEIPVSTSVTRTPSFGVNCLEVEITFDSLPSAVQDDPRLAGVLLDLVANTVLFHTNMPNERISNLTIEWSQDIIQFVLLKSTNDFAKESAQFMETLSRAVYTGNFSVSFHGSVFRAIAVRQLPGQTTPSLHVSSTMISSVLHSVPSHSGIVLVIAITSIIAIVIILVVVILVFNYCYRARQSKYTQNQPVDSTA